MPADFFMMTINNRTSFRAPLEASEDSKLWGDLLELFDAYEQFKSAQGNRDGYELQVTRAFNQLRRNSARSETPVPDVAIPTEVESAMFVAAHKMDHLFPSITKLDRGQSLKDHDDRYERDVLLALFGLLYLWDQHRQDSDDEGKRLRVIEAFVMLRRAIRTDEDAIHYDRND